MKIEYIEWLRVKYLLNEIRQRYRQSSNWTVIYDNLIDFAKSEGYRVIEDSQLISSRGSLGCLWVQLKVIRIQNCNITEMVSTLAHEVGHVFCFKARMLRKYEYDEGLADVFGRVLVNILRK